MDLHLSVSGALTGDMFIAAVLDAFPLHEERVLAAIDAVDAVHPVSCALLDHLDAEVSGRRFEIVPFEKYFGHIPFAFSKDRTTWDSAREQLRAAQIRPAVRAHAAKLFELLAEAEFERPELAGAMQAADPAPCYSVLQLVGAAASIDVLGPVRWRVAPLPVGASVTPTAAAILDYLCPPRMRGQPLPRMHPLARSGTGFGSPPAANSYLRLLCFDLENAAFTQADISAQVAMPARGGSSQRPAR
jgi:hypothetical protein